MPTQNIHVLTEPLNAEELSEELAKLQKIMKYLMNGNLDFENIRVKGIIAETIDVNELSAITANLGHIIAGIIESVEIYGSKIATSRDSYPRAEMSETEKMFKVATSPNRYAEFNASWNDGSSSLPTLLYSHDGKVMQMGYGKGASDLMGISSSDVLALGGLAGIFSVQSRIYNWDFLINGFTGKTMQQELNSLTDAIDDLTTAINNKANKGSSTGSAGSHNHGIADGTQLMTGDGSTVTWHSAGGHSHTQN